MSRKFVPIASSVPELTELGLRSELINRHGLIAGATGTGKTVTLRVMAEAFSELGVPVFMADVKGDLTGLAVAGEPNPRLEERAAQVQRELRFREMPVVFWDVWGERGHPIRTTISELGPLLLARLLNLNETQEGVLHIIFRLADDEGLLLLDLKDFRALLQYTAENRSEIATKYGNISAASIGAIQRNLLMLENESDGALFGEPALELEDFLQTDANGRGVVNILAADRLLRSPRTYAALLLWMLSELFERLPEVGDLDRPKLAFFFDEAHLLFTDIPSAVESKIEQVVRLIRSKGVGVYFVTQNPMDLPERVLGQLGNRVQHALRAFTPSDQKAVRAAAGTFRPNPKFEVESVIGELGVGEALVSCLDEKGQPTVVERALIHPPCTRLQPLDDATLHRVVENSVLHGTYETTLDRESAFEVLAERQQSETPQKPATGRAGRKQTAAERQPEGIGGVLFGSTGPRGGRREGLVETMAKSTIRTIGSGVGRGIVRGLLGSLFGSKRR
jgi:DNA helicase HerA-like ATPase